ncbi:MAG: hypothetical protein FRX49_07067, partial [Trebouxia sp. A1-2]
SSTPLKSLSNGASHMHAETYDASGAESPFVPTEPVLTTPVPGAVDLARSLAIDLARQRVLTETASSKNHQQRLDQAFSAIKAFEHAHSFTPIHDIKGSSNELDKISVAANIRRNSSLQSLGDHNNIALHGSPTASFTGKFSGRDGRSSRLSNLRGGNTGRLLAPQGVTSQNIAVADFPSGHELDAANGTVSEDAAIEVTRKLVVDSLKASNQTCWNSGFAVTQK